MSKPIDQELLPCPFCACTMRIESNRDWHRLFGDHEENCVFVDSETMMVPASDDQLALLVEDWNRRVQPAGVAVPEGWKLVPVELTKDMHAAMMDANGSLFNVYRAMLAAAPHPVSGEQKPDMADAYVGAMEDRNIWKRRALEAEAKIRTYDQRIVDLGVLSMRTAVEKPAAQDVAGLVEALERIAYRAEAFVEDEACMLPHSCEVLAGIARKALAAHRAQQGEQP